MEKSFSNIDRTIFFATAKGCFSFQQCHGWNCVVLQFLEELKLNTLLKSVPLATKNKNRFVNEKHVVICWIH